MRHAFELSDPMAIYDNQRNISSRHNEVLQKEIEKMLRAEIIKPASFSLTFPVVIPRKKDGKPGFCANYRTPNARLKPSRWPIPLIEEIFDELYGSRLFATLDLSSG